MFREKDRNKVFNLQVPTLGQQIFKNEKFNIILLIFYPFCYFFLTKNHLICPIQRKNTKKHSLQTFLTFGGGRGMILIREGGGDDCCILQYTDQGLENIYFFSIFSFDTNTKFVVLKIIN